MAPAGSRSFEALLEKTKATLTGKSGGQNAQSQDSPKLERRFSAKTLPKSWSHGSVASHSYGRRLFRGASMMLPVSTTPRPDEGTWTCRGTFSRCFLRRKMNTVGDGEDKERAARLMFSDEQTPQHIRPTLSAKANHAVSKADFKAEQSDVATAMNDMSLKARLAHVNDMKGKTYSLPAGFAAARKDALEMISLVRSSVLQPHRGERPEGGKGDPERFSMLLSVQAKALGSACSQMALEHSSPEELLLTLTHSFHTLCCLTQACMSLVEGLDMEAQRREVVAKVDEVVMNYVCLLKAAEAASGSATNDQSVNALTHYSTAMSAIINALIHSLKTLLNK